MAEIKRTISISESRSGMYSGYAERRKVRLSESKDLLAGILPNVALSIKLNGRMKFNGFNRELGRNKRTFKEILPVDLKHGIDIA